MVETRRRWLFGFLAAAVTALLLPAASPACPFCVDERGPTLIGEFDEASMVLYGTFVNAKLDNGGGIESGHSDFVIERVLKGHPAIENKKIITLPKYIPASSKKFVIFCGVYKSSIDPYKGEEAVPGGQLLEYLSSSLELKKAPVGERLRHCFNFLNSSDLTVSMDAYREFARADYGDYKDMARKLPADTLAAWLQDPKTPAYRYGLYASLLGHCGDGKKHGEMLRGMLDDPKKRMGSGVDGMMAGYLMLEPKEGWQHLQKYVSNPKEDFFVRYAVLRTLRFVWDYRTDLLSKDEVLKGMGKIIELHDLADFAIDDLRLWGAWQMTDQVLDLFNKPGHAHPVVKRSILRFALCSPSPRAKMFVADQRKRDASWVSDTEEMLRFDPAPKVAPPAKK